MAPLVQLLMATANLDHDSCVSSRRRAATAPRGSEITETIEARLRPYWPALPRPPVRPPERPA
ncbi:MAG: hypothetical protein IPF77_03895 [Gemmatimonadetes bacterium]|nr:hypothetical protein [Gemmatimonadota bacterium]